MKVIVKITHGNQIADFQLETSENLSELPNHEKFVNDIIEKVFEEFRATFNESQ